jgi:tRNA modification GTPase
MTDERPIAAIATASGRGAIGVVRVSGRGLGNLARELTGRTLEPRRAHLVGLLDAHGGLIDRGLALYFPGPHSYTGEDVLEFQGHGGAMVLQRVLARVLHAGQSIGLRLARPGEFTERAFLNGKLDLAQAEAVADLIDASSERAARAAVRSLEGEFSSRVSDLARAVLDLRILVEATLDFPEEELDFLQAAEAAHRLERAIDTLDEVRRAARRGALLRDGMTVVLAGEPNVGKSSLLNALAGTEVAIVTPIAGTTRDRIAQALLIEGVAINVVDTAGLRETQDEVERIGISRSWEAVTRADLVLHLVDARAHDSEAATVIEQGITARIGRHVPVLRVLNKIDLLAGDRPGGLESSDPERSDRMKHDVPVSALTGEGLGALRAALLRAAGDEPGTETLFTARERQVEALTEAAEHLDDARAILVLGNERLELLAEELRLAHDALGRITGKVDADQLLGEIFRNFCIGK